MVDHLKVPLILTCFRIHRDDRISKEIGTLSVRAIVIARRAPEGHIDDVAGLIDGHGESPVIDARAVLPVVTLPHLVARFTWPGHGVELPQLRAGPHIISPRVAR